MRSGVALLAIVLLGVIASASALSSNAATPSPTSPSAVGAPAVSTRATGSIDHIIIIVQENRSFDHYFGTFPGANGIPTRPDGTPKICIPDWVLGHCSRPYHSTTQYQQGGPHDQRASEIDRNGGKMNGFVTSVARGKDKCAAEPSASRPRADGSSDPKRQPDVMSYHTGKEIPNYWAYAEHYLLQDHMFAPADSWTLPSHLFLVSGWSALCPDTTDPMSCRSDLDLKGRHRAVPLRQSPIYAWTDITCLLGNDGSLEVYIGKGTCVQDAVHPEGGPVREDVVLEEPAPGLRRRASTDGHLGNVHHARGVHPSGAQRHAPGRLVDHAGQPRERAPGIGHSDPKRAGLRHAARERGDARPRTGTPPRSS